MLKEVFNLQSLTSLLIISQLVFTVVAGIYFFESIKSQKATKTTADIDSKNETERLKELREIHLTTPLSEKTRPFNMDQIIGQEEGIKALRAALCSPNPQHVIIYGPPGVGKTAAARIVLNEAKRNCLSPFRADANFVEIDATTLRFDERSIADPLIGSVHDPIYQGAGAYGMAGVPQPKEGAVTKAHGGILFIDEIGELHSLQMNKLLKVLEDRKVMFSSSYYSSTNTNIPKHIHDIFENGLPADFRLVGATTRKPEEIPPALRSRCTEIFFNSLKPCHIEKITENAVKMVGLSCDYDSVKKVASYAKGGRDAINIIQTAASLALMEKRTKIRLQDIDWVIEAGRFSPVFSKKVENNDKIGVVNGLAVYGNNSGALLEIEASAVLAENKGQGKISITGIVEKEEINNGQSVIKRKSNAFSSVENAVTVLANIMHIKINDYDIHVNFPGGMPVDGPSAGVAIATAIFSAVTKRPIPSKTAITGEISILGMVLPVGGVTCKINAAIEAGATRVIIPKANWLDNYSDMKIEVKRTENILEVFKILFDISQGEFFEDTESKKIPLDIDILTAKGAKV